MPLPILAALATASPRYGLNPIIGCRPIVINWIPTSPRTRLTTASLAVPASLLTNITDWGLSLSENVFVPWRATTVSGGVAGSAAGGGAAWIAGPGSFTIASAGARAATAAAGGAR